MVDEDDHERADAILASFLARNKEYKIRNLKKIRIKVAFYKNKRIVAFFMLGWIAVMLLTIGILEFIY